MTPTARGAGAPVTDLRVSAYTIPTDAPESDGTLEWDRTTIVVVEIEAVGRTGIGYTYAHSSAANLISDTLAGLISGRNALDIPAAWEAMVRAVRNIGRPGIASMAISAVDSALWDLKSRILDLPLADLLGRVRNSVPVYGSGGFTSYGLDRLRQQLGDWVADGMGRVKMKVGRHPDEDRSRVRAARETIGADVDLFVDANGAYTRKGALRLAQQFARERVAWFEEPVTSDDLEGLRLLRDRAPAGMDIAAGEYGHDLFAFRKLLDEGAIDVLQADATRCAGITGFLRAGALCRSRAVPLSSHGAPAIHLHACCALESVVHMEYFHDHVRIERMLFDGAARPVNGELRPDFSRPGLGLELKRADAKRFAA